ncbi:hypothetical protein BGZ82_005568 [Podila clonocystis]|nr:hypothetical protein BGZ82_005568 [Podila clonocystis]
MDDQIRSESSFFWKLSIQPTVFTAPFCESVKRSFHFEPKSSGKASHLWQCDIIEDMINGVATMAIDIHRASFETSSTLPPPSGSVAVMDLSQRNRSEVPQELLQLKQDNQEFLPGTSKVVEYRTISILTPKYLTPLMSTFLRGRSTDSIRVEVDATEVLHDGKYVIVLVLSEEKSMSQITSPSSCHRIMDSLYHDIQPTSQPDPDSADVWFEFPEESKPSGQQEQLSRSSGDGLVTTLGAHWCVISKYESIVRWIDHERQVEEEQQRQEEKRVRREQHEAQMRFLHQQRMQLEAMWQQEMRMLHEIHRRQCPQQQAQMHVIDPAQMYHRRPPVQMSLPMGASVTMPMLMPPLPMQGQYYGDPYNPNFPYQAPPMPFQPLPYQPPQQPQPCYHTPRPGPQDSTFPQSRPFQSYQTHPLSLSWQPPQRQEAPVLPHNTGSRSSPSLGSRKHNTIRVRQISSSTFRVLLQYLYTSQICLTGEQQRKIDKYWSLHHSPTRNNDNKQEREEEEEVLEQGRVHLPASQSLLGCLSLVSHHSTTSGGSSSDESESPRPILLPPLEPMALRSGNTNDSVFARTLRRMTQDTPASDYATALRLSCSRLVAQRDRGSLDLLDSFPSSSCSWESLVHASHVVGLQQLHARATKALGYHCQMLVLRTIMHVVAEVAHNGFDEPQLDLQLAMNEDLLGTFVELYASKGVEDEEGVRVGRGMVVPVEREGRSDRREIEGEEDEPGSQEAVTTTTKAPGLLDGAECQDQILELCKDIRSLFLDLQDTMA